MESLRSRPTTSNRDSNALRASILDAALELGIRNQTVAKWIFDPVNEDEEAEEEHNTFSAPGLATTPSVTSDESYPLLSTPASTSIQSRSKDDDSMNELAYSIDDGLHIDSQRHLVHYGDSSPAQDSRARTPVNPTSVAAKPNKLRKSRPDGHESDGGYISDRRNSKNEQRKDKDKKGGYESEGTPIAVKKKKKAGDAVPKSGPDDDTDGGYFSESTKKRMSFFRRKKPKKHTKEPENMPPIPSHLSVSHAFRSGRSISPSTFASSSSIMSDSTEITNSFGDITPTATHYSIQEPVLTRAFKEDAPSIAGSVDWSTAYSHFSPVAQSSRQTFLNTQPLKTKPSPLLLSPIPSTYGHTSETSPVRSEIGNITPDPRLPGTVQRDLLEAVVAANNTIGKPPDPSRLSPSSPSVVPSTEFIVPSPNSPVVTPGGTVRPRTLAHYDIPPPSPPPSGPLPRPPAPQMKLSRLRSSSSTGTRTPPGSCNPVLSQHEGESMNSIKSVEDRGSSEGHGRRAQQPPFPLYPSHTYIKPRESRNLRSAHSYSEIRIQRVSDELHAAMLPNSNIDVAALSSRGQNRAAREEDIVSYLSAYSDESYDDEGGLSSSEWSPRSLIEQDSTPRSRLVKNVEAMDPKNGREMIVANAVVPRSRPPGPLPPKSILRKKT